MNEPVWLRIVTLRAQRRMLWCRELWARHRYADEQALAITHSEVERALAPAAETLREELAFYAENPAAAGLGAELEALESPGSRDEVSTDPQWQRLIDVCRLTGPEAALLACALAAELQPPLRRVYGYLQDEVVALDPSPALVAALWTMPVPPLIGPRSQLLAWRLARPLETGREPESSTAVWVADPTLAEQLLEGEAQPSTGTRLATELEAPTAPMLFAQELDGIAEFVASFRADGKPALEIELAAPGGSGRATLAAQAADRLGRRLLKLDCATLASLPDPATAAIRELRHAQLEDAVVALANADALPEFALRAIGGLAPLAFLTTHAPLMSQPAGGAIRRTYELRPLERELRLELWSAVGAGDPPAPIEDWELRPREVVAAARTAAAGSDAVREVCRRLLFDTPSDLVRPLRLPYSWDDLVVSDQLMAHLRELEAQAVARGEVLDDWGLARLVPLGRGVSAMFAGPSGTGKTMAAQVLARALGLDLLRVDLAGVVNKYIGETEKHLRAVFAACERAPVMLFFDEADALFGKRMQVSDAHDRFANIEVDYLLQRMEEFDGVAVLATNRKGDIDTAFLRRLRFVIDFAPPTVAERERLWRLALESSTDAGGRSLVGDLDWGTLARGLDLNGAGIKASALAAAFLARSEDARIERRHIVAAARRELQKQGVVVRAGQLEPAPGDDGPAGAPSHSGPGAPSHRRRRGNGVPPLSAGEVELMVSEGL